MKRILLATIAAVSFAGVAAAQEAPVLQGNYDAAVLNLHNGNGQIVRSQLAQDGSLAVGTRAIAIQRDGDRAGYGPQVSDFEVYSGR